MKIGMVCPYSFDEPGGVQIHALELCEELRSRGHEVSLIGPGNQEKLDLPDYVTVADKQFSVHYNGSVARLSFGRKTVKHIRQWIAEGDFDVVHIHEPNSPSYSLLTLREATGPIVATYHAASDQSRALKLATPLLRPYLERIRAGIAVSEEARKWHVEMLGGDPVLIPNGVETQNYRDASMLKFSGSELHRPRLMFLGRFEEPRKGLQILLDAMPEIIAQHPTVELLIAGGGDISWLTQKLIQSNISFVTGMDEDPEATVRILGRVSEEDKASALALSDIYIAPNTGGESFGIVLVEAMAAATAVVASDIPAFRAVLDDGNAGALFTNKDSADLARVVNELLGDRDRVEQLSRIGSQRSAMYDWEAVGATILDVYDTVATPGQKVALRK